ncbi:MAG: redoxin domain-containing protein [Gammaproteobacteria bacterium]|nr:redoxin domain-containing protein [Gammaproteobacteria bacterium]
MILGVSCDPPRENRAFKEKFDFPFDLLCDVERAVSMLYGAADSPQTIYPARISYLIDPQGRVARVYAEVNPASHADDVLRDLAAL